MYMDKKSLFQRAELYKQINEVNIVHRKSRSLKVVPKSAQDHFEENSTQLCDESGWVD